MFRTRFLTPMCAGLVLLANSPANAGSPAQMERSQYPDSALEAQTEVTGSWQGRIETLIVDNFQAGTSRRRLYLQTARATLELEVAAGNLPTGQLAEVTGRVSGKRLIASQVKALRAEAAAGTCSATGEQKAAVILVSFPSKALLSSVTPGLIRDSFFGGGRTVDTFLRESSFGRTWVTGDVLGPFVLDADYFDQPLAVRDAALRAAAPAANLGQYNRIFVVAPQGETGMDSGGMALLGCGQIPSPQGVLNASSIWLGAESMIGHNEIVDTVSHELGHGFGLEHARSADYGGEPLGPAGQPPAPWDGIHDYGDSFSNMGRQSGQWAAPHKAYLGWLQTGTNIQDVTTGGNFTLAPYELSGGGQTIRVRRGTSDAWLWLEYRQPLGTFDATLPAAVSGGALIHYQDNALAATQSDTDPAAYTNLVSLHPAAPFFNDPVLRVGETWKDPYGSLSLTVNTATTAGLNVSVSYAPAPVCPSSVGGAQSFDAAGGTGTISVTAPAGCSWSSAASDSWISVESKGSRAGNGSLSFTVAENINISPRWGKIMAGNAFVIVTQSGASGWITISPKTGLVSAEGGTGKISVATSSPDFSWAYQSDVPWITDVECSCYQSVGPATLRYIVAANAGPERTGAITAGGVVFTVTQQASTTKIRSLTWELLAPPDAPSARLNQAMAPFGHAGEAILYGGVWNTTISAETWLWNGSRWKLLSPANSPGMLSAHAMAYDEARGQIVLFGGIGGNVPVYSDQTWIWDGNNWRQMHPAVSPPARCNHAMAYDAASRKVVLFGGDGGWGETNDTWTWDGVNWTQVISPASPVARLGHSMAFDPVRGETLLFGGFQYRGVLTWFSDTWAWDGSEWHQMLTPTPPAGRSGHVLAYHPGLRSVVMIGGTGGKNLTGNGWNYDFRREVWLWTGDEWVQQFPDDQPGPAYTIGAAYDDIKQALSVHLGDDLTCASRGPKTFLLKAPAGSTFRAPRPTPVPRR
jgi:M6 family metalloprotease-like protein